MNGDEPLEESVLGGRRGLAFALSERADDGHDDISRHPMRRVEIFDECGHTRLVQLGLDGRDLYHGAQSVLVQPRFEGMMADHVDDARNFDKSLLGGGARGCSPDQYRSSCTRTCEPRCKVSSASCKLAGRSSGGALAVGG